MTLSVIFLLSFIILKAQDKIILRNSHEILCKITEILSEEIKYKIPDEDIIFSIDKEKVLKVILESGKEMSFQKEMTNMANYADNKINAIKLAFLKPLSGYTEFGYERNLKASRSIEGSLGIIGLGYSILDRDPKGVYIKGGYKFIRSPDYYVRGMRYAHLLKGGYVKPEIFIGYYSYNDHSYDWVNDYNTTKIESAFGMAIMLNLGKQWIIDNFFLVDWHFGVGYGYSSVSGSDFYRYGTYIGNNSFPFAFNTGLKVGILL